MEKRTVKCEGAKTEDSKIPVIFDFTGVTPEQILHEAVGQVARNLYNNTSPNSNDKDGRMANKKAKRAKMLAEVAEKGSYTLKVAEFLSGSVSAQLTLEETVVISTDDQLIAAQKLIAEQLKARNIKA